MRVAPFLRVRSNIVRSGTPNCAWKIWWKSNCVAEPSSDGERRQRPSSYAVTYTLLGLCGSSFTFVIPNELPAAPSQTSVNVAPPLVDSYRPAGLAPGSRLIWPPLPITCERPRTARAEPTKMWRELVGSTAFELIARPRNASVLGGVQVNSEVLTHE